MININKYINVFLTTAMLLNIECWGSNNFNSDFLIYEESLGSQKRKYYSGEQEALFAFQKKQYNETWSNSDSPANIQDISKNTSASTLMFLGEGVTTDKGNFLEKDGNTVPIYVLQYPKNEVCDSLEEDDNMIPEAPRPEEDEAYSFVGMH